MTYRGQNVELLLGQGGLISEEAVGVAPPDTLLQGRNIRYTQGLVRKEQGAVKRNTVPFNAIVWDGWDWWPDPTHQYQIEVITDGVAVVLLKSVDGATHLTLASNPVTVSLPSGTFVEGGHEAPGNQKRLFYFLAGCPTQILTGLADVTTVLTGPPEWTGSAWPTCGANHLGRLWAAGGPTAPHRLYYSQLTDHTSFSGTGAGTLEVYPGEGQEIVSLMSYRGLLIVWKYPRGIYQVDTRDPDPTQWSVYRLTLAWGAINSATQANIGNDVFFLDPQGEFQLLSAAQELGETRGQSLSSALQLQEWIRSHVNLNAIRRSRMAYYARRQQVHVGVCTPETDLNDLRLVWDFSRPDRPRMTESPRDGCTALWVARDPIEQRLAAGDAFGFVWILDWPGTTRDGSGYDGRLQTMWSDLGAGTRR